VVGGIYSLNHQNGRWGTLLSMGAPDSPVRQPRHPTVGIRPLELPTCGPPDRSCLLSGAISAPALTSARAVRALYRCQPTVELDRCAGDRCSAWHTGQSGATPDSPVNYSGVTSQIPEGGKFGVILPGAPEIVRWRIGQSGAPDQDNLRLSFALFI
jgi:hypothetical protein